MDMIIGKQSIRWEHLDYELRKRITLSGGSSTTNTVSTVVNKTNYTDPVKPSPSTDFSQVYIDMRASDGTIEEQMRQYYDALKCDMESRFCAIGSQVIFAADTAQSGMTVLPSSATTILWQSIDLTHPYVGYDASSGIWTPTQSGYYKITAYFNDMHGNSSAHQALTVTSTNGSTPADVDDYTGTTADRLYGHKIVYCNGTSDTFKVQMTNYDPSVTMTYHSVLSGFHKAYVTVEYAGPRSATT